MTTIEGVPLCARCIHHKDVHVDGRRSHAGCAEQGLTDADGKALYIRCSDLRSDDSRCGPEARRFVPRG